MNGCGNMVVQLQNSVSLMRNELKTLRKQVDALKHVLRSETRAIRQILSSSTLAQFDASKCPPPTDWFGGNDITPARTASRSSRAADKTVRRIEGEGGLQSLISCLSDVAIGRIRTCFREKNGTPRQPGLCPTAVGSIKVDTFSNPSHSLAGLEEYSHVWLVFLFNENKQDSVKAKVTPPRLNGKKRGVFATRSPHRPCPIGLSLAKLESIEGSTVYVSGVDMIDGTPILDMKPYIPMYDNPERGHSVAAVGESGEQSNVRVAPWLDSPPAAPLEVRFSEEAEHQFSLFQCQYPALASGNSSKPLQASAQVEHKEEKATGSGTKNTTFCSKSSRESTFILESFKSLDDARQAIVDVLKQDPRSVYRRNKCLHDTYKFSIDNLNLSCQFFEGSVTVTDIQPKVYWKR